MDMVKCRTCGERHPTGPCPRFASSGHKIIEGLQEAIDYAKGDKTAARMITVQVPSPPPTLEKPSKQPYDRNAKHREYMKTYIPEWRRRRAKEKK